MCKYLAINWLWLQAYQEVESLLWFLIPSMLRDSAAILRLFSAYARQFLGGLERPDVDKIDGLSPVIAIEQKTTSKSPRSTVVLLPKSMTFCACSMHVHPTHIVIAQARRWSAILMVRYNS